MLIEELSVPVAEAVPASVHQMDATSTEAPTPAPLPVPADLPSPHTSSLAAALQRLTTNPAMTLTPGRHVSSSATLGAAIDLCCSTQHPEGVVEQEKGRQGTKRKRKSTKGEEEVKVEGETEMVRTYAQCKLYYSIGWLAAESAAKSLLDSDQRHLGVSLNQLSFALLKAAQRLNRPSAEAMQIVRHKIEFFATKMTASFVSESESASLPADARMGEKAVEDSATDGLAFTRVAAAAVTYRETRLLSSIATADSGGREQLMCFWSSVMTAHPSLMGYSTALFEVLDSHMAAGNCTGTIAWAGVALTGGMLPPMRVKELLIRYSDTTSLHCLPTLLPLLSKLSTSQSDLEFEDGLSTYDTPVLYRRGGVSDLYLPLPMSVLRSLSVTLLEQHRLGDARVLLKCVHPFQWPYDELLLALATASSITGANIDSVGEKGSEGRKRECSAVLRRREELSLSLALNPISSSTAKALLAMQADTSASEKGEKEKGTGNSESEKSFRILVARAVKSGGQDGAMRSASASAVLGGDNNNGRSFSSISSNALSEGDVRSGLLALLTLYSLTDSSNATQEISAQPQDQPADSASAMTDSSSSVGDDWDLDRGAESAAVPAPSASKWVDPESPENLAKFLLDVENLGSRSTQSGYSESAIDSPVGSSSEPGAVGGGAGGGSKEGAVAERRVSNVGLRVSGSKKSWKRSSTFGSSFDKSVRGSSSIPPFSYPYPSTSLSVTPTPTPSAASTVLPAVEVSSTEAGVDEIVCRELARSLLAAVTSQISSLEGLDTHQEAGTGAGVHSTEGVEVSRFGGLSDRDLDKQKRLIRAADEKQYQGICGAVAELFSLSNQQQADRLFRTFSDTPTLCARLLHLCALRSDPGPAALVLEQMAVQHTISREIAVMWQVQCMLCLFLHSV